MTTTSAAMFTSPRIAVVDEVSGVNLRSISSIHQTAIYHASHIYHVSLTRYIYIYIYIYISLNKFRIDDICEV